MENSFRLSAHAFRGVGRTEGACAGLFQSRDKWRKISFKDG